MKKTSKRIVFFGTEDFSAKSLEKLIADGWAVALVVTKPDSKRGRGKQISEPLVKQIARSHNITVLQPTNVQDIAPQIKEIGNRLGVLVSYGKILPKEILDMFEPTGIINIHPSSLPKYRGPSPIETAILNGDTSIGISLIKLTEEMDAGPIYHQTLVDIDSNMGAHDAYATISSVASAELIKILPGIIDGSVLAKPQEEKQATYTRLLSKNDGIINWENSAEEILRGIRAYEIWPKSRTTIGTLEVIIKQAHKVPAGSEKPGEYEIIDNSALMIQTGKDRVYIDKLQPVGKNEMTTKAFLAGYKRSL